MSQEIEQHGLSARDQDLIECNQLGTVVDIYRLGPSYIRFFRGIGWISLTIGMLVFLTVIVLGIIDWRHSLALQQHPQAFNDLLAQQQIAEDRRFLFQPLLASAFALWSGWFYLGLIVPQIQFTHLIICDWGFLQVKDRRVEVVHWKDILAIKQTFSGSEYYIERRGADSVTLESAYQNLGQLVAVIEYYSEVTAS